MQITWFVLFYMIQAWAKEYNWEKNKKHSQTENQTDWPVHLWKNPKAKHRFSPQTLNKRNISGVLVNNKAEVSVVSDKCV